MSRSSDSLLTRLCPTPSTPSPTRTAPAPSPRVAWWRATKSKSFARKSSMSRPPLTPNVDILRLIDEGYEVEIRQDYLLVHHVPYVTPQKTVAFSTLVSALSLE